MKAKNQKRKYLRNPLDDTLYNKCLSINILIFTLKRVVPETILPVLCHVHFRPWLNSKLRKYILLLLKISHYSFSEDVFILGKYTIIKCCIPTKFQIIPILIWICEIFYPFFCLIKPILHILF